MQTQVSVDVVGIVAVVIAVYSNGQINRRAKRKEIAATIEIEKSRAAELATLTAQVTDLKEKLDAETGGNSGGIREKVNSMDEKVDWIKDAFVKLSDKVNVNSEAIAEIKGSLKGAKA